MKQHITTKQLNELSERGMEKLILWTVDDRDYNSRLSIGQMIEFLKYYGKLKQIHNTDVGMTRIEWKAEPQPTSICDALWEAVKEVLEK
jgi:hypothetical protein